MTSPETAQFYKCRICGAGVAAVDAQEHLDAHGRVMTALATDQAEECGND